MHPDDPRRSVDAPIRGVLFGIVAFGIVIVGAVVFGAAAAVVPALHDASDAAAVAVTGFLLVVGAAVHVTRWLREPLDEELRANAWYTARERYPEDAMLALVVAGWVPVAVAVSLFVMLWAHLNDPNPALRGAWAVLGVPPIVAAWLFAATAWLDACRDAIARAIGESNRRFRRYWANLGGS